MVVNLLSGIEKVSVLRMGWSIMKDTNLAASKHAFFCCCFFIPDSTDLRTVFFSRLHIHH